MTGVLPELTAIRESTTQRELLTDPQPLAIQRSWDATVFVLHVQSGPAGPLRLRVGSDQLWLVPQQTDLEIPPNSVVEFQATVHADGPGEFALLTFAWNAGGEELAESILIWRQGKPPKPPPSIPPPMNPPPQVSPPPPPSAEPPTGGLPDWMRNDA